MDFNFDDEDAGSTHSFFERLHSEGTPKNLSQVFEEDLQAFEHESQSLRYTPRSRKLQEPPSFRSALTFLSDDSSSSGSPRAPGPGGWDVLFARVINVYQGAETGPMGLAVTMRATKGECNLIIYKQKTHIITTLRLVPNGRHVHLRDSYVQFYDRSRAFWSLRFMYEKDEPEFVRMMMDNSLPLEVHSPGSTGSVEQQKQALEIHCRKHSEEDGEQDDKDDHSWDKSCINIIREQDRRRHPPSNATYLVDPRPQPKPRLRTMAPNEEKQGQDSDEDPKPRSQAHMKAPRDHFKQEHGHNDENPKPRSPAYMAALREHFKHIEREARPKPEPVPDDVLVTRMPRPIGTTDPATPPSSSPPRLSLLESVRSSATRLGRIISDQILDDLATPPSSPPLSARSSATLLGNLLDDLDPDLDGVAIVQVLRKRPAHVATQHGPATKEATTTMDPEDKFIELEQQVLDLKKENRALAKSIKERDDEMQEFQTSSADLLDILLKQNKDLKQRNSLFLDTITEKIARGKTSAMNVNNNEQPSSSTLSCENCEHAAEEINFLKEHIAAMKQAMRDAEL